PDFWRPPPGAGGPLRARVQLAVGLPSGVERIPGLRLVNFTMFEAARVPPAWLGSNLRHDLVVVPTESSRRAWLEAGMPEERLALCPLGVDPPRPRPPLVLIDDRGRRAADRSVRFLNVSDLSVRKNLGGLLRVWLRATRDSDDAALVLKVGKGHDGDRALFLKILRHVEGQVGRTAGQAAPLFVMTGRYPDETIAQLHGSCTHYISLSFGEGWDLPMTQAGASGLALIAPAHSAYLEYLDDSTATLLPARRCPATDIDGSPCIGFSGLDWWRPDEDAAILAVRAAVAGELPPKSARSRLLGEFSWDRATARLLAVLDSA
ncbi:MAG: glycosyltransferase, partial [Alphaproteobacteria bacterium]|nr:glycosyltransferase [Alphaproteobacteria bacterium]